MKMQRNWLLPALAALTICVGRASDARAEVDHLVELIPKSLATGGKTIGTFGYDPVGDAFYISTFGASPPFGQPTVLKITGVGTESPVSTPLVSETQQQLYYRGGDPDISAGTPVMGGLLLNPLPIDAGGDTIDAYSFALITDAALTRIPGSTSVTDPNATKRVYSFNLQAVPAVGDPPPPYGDGRDVYTTRVTLADMQAVAGTTNTTTNTSRQFAWSGDGQSIYFLDTSPNFGGVWKVGAISGAPERLLAESADLNTEPAVLSAGGVDTILFAGGGSTANTGGIDKITYDGATASARTAYLPGAVLADFMQLAPADIDIRSMTTDAAGNVYFNNIDSDRRAVFQLDTSGRLSKVVSYSERVDVFGAGGSINSNTLRMQTRSTMFEGAEGSFEVTQLLYAESGTISAIAGAYVFQPGDFNRDDTVDGDDIALFAAQLTVRGVVKMNVEDLKFDMNGNNVVDWKDVKLLQQFVAFSDGDIDMDGVVNATDFAVLEMNYGMSMMTWIQGDFDGDDDVDLADLVIFNGNFLDGDATYDGLVDIFDVAVISNNWGTVGPAGDVNEDGVIDIFDVATVSNNWAPAPEEASGVPEPSSVLLASFAAAAIACGARRGRTGAVDCGEHRS